jgi:hypothetical protein
MTQETTMPRRTLTIDRTRGLEPQSAPVGSSGSTRDSQLIGGEELEERIAPGIKKPL